MRTENGLVLEPVAVGVILLVVVHVFVLRVHVLRVLLVGQYCAQRRTEHDADEERGPLCVHRYYSKGRGRAADCLGSK